MGRWEQGRMLGVRREGRSSSRSPFVLSSALVVDSNSHFRSTLRFLYLLSSFSSRFLPSSRRYSSNTSFVVSHNLCLRSRRRLSFAKQHSLQFFPPPIPADFKKASRIHIQAKRKKPKKKPNRTNETTKKREERASDKRSEAG